MNRLIIIGNLTRDPEKRVLQSGETVTSFTVAVNNRRRRQSDTANGQDDTTFFRVSAWRELGENCAKYLAKGRKVAVVGPVNARTYVANDGTTRVSLEVNANEVEFLSSRSDVDAAPVQDTAYSAPEPTAQNNGFTVVESEELPF
jgi:single-strand DNA-binding protein